MVAAVNQTIHTAVLVRHAVLVKQLKRDRVEHIAVAHVGNKRVELRDGLEQ